MPPAQLALPSCCNRLSTAFLHRPRGRRFNDKIGQGHQSPLNSCPLNHLQPGPQHEPRAVAWVALPFRQTARWCQMLLCTSNLGVWGGAPVLLWGFCQSSSIDVRSSSNSCIPMPTSWSVPGKGGTCDQPPVPPPWLSPLIWAKVGGLGSGMGHRSYVSMAANSPSVLLLISCGTAIKSYAIICILPHIPSFQMQTSKGK